MPSKRGLSKYRWVAATSCSNGVLRLCIRFDDGHGFTLLLSAVPAHGAGNHFVFRQYGARFTGDGVITTAVGAGTEPLRAVPSGLGL